MVAVSGVASLFGFLRISEILPLVESHIQGRLLVFFPGVYEQDNYRLLDAREANALVSGILNFSQLFVAPFEGILRTDALHSGGSVLDIAAILAFIGWTLLEALAIAAVNIFRREPV